MEEIVQIIPPHNNQITNSFQKYMEKMPCPFCHEEIASSAEICPLCEKVLPSRIEPVGESTDPEAEIGASSHEGAPENELTKEMIANLRISNQIRNHLEFL